MSLQLRYWWIIIARGKGDKLVMWDSGREDRKGIFSFFHSVRVPIVPVKLSPLVRNMSLFLAMGKLKSGSKDLPQGVSEVMFH